MLALLDDVTGRAGGDWILVIVLVVTILALAYGLYTRTGSGIERHPWGNRHSHDPQPGAVGPGETSGRDEGEHVPWEHGTK
jgi:hypothetical protein